MTRNNTLVSLDFLALCLLIFLTYCNITVFYNLYLYLQQIGIGPNWRGFLIGSSSLSTIAFFLFASPYLTTRNAARCAAVGGVLLLGCGLAYLSARSVGSILAVRLVNGAAIYLLSAACMTMMVSRIPAEHSGQAFSLYSVALLLPYSLVPLVCDFAVPHLPSAAHGYLVMSLLLLPGLALVFVINRRQRAHDGQVRPPAKISLADMYRNAASPSIGLVLVLNTIYIVSFSSLFFMAEGLFRSRGFSNVGSYFTIQMCCMIGVRLCGNHLFDRVRKVRLIRFSFVLSAASFLMAAWSYRLWGLYGSSLVMGIGMGISSPALYGLMFTISPPRFKAADSNLMMLSLQIGNFLGPLFGAWVMQRLGYAGLLMVDAAVCLLGAGMCRVLTSRRVDPGGLAARA